MTKRVQYTVALILGALALALAAAVVWRYAPAARAAAVEVVPAPAPTEAAAVERSAQYGLVDLNTADAEELMLLPGIGEVLSARIIETREANGPFETKEDVLAVSGIGEATYEKIAPYITY